jgi:hypothetical protein
VGDWKRDQEGGREGSLPEANMVMNWMSPNEENVRGSKMLKKCGELDGLIDLFASLSSTVVCIVRRDPIVSIGAEECSHVYSTCSQDSSYYQFPPTHSSHLIGFFFVSRW